MELYLIRHGEIAGDPHRCYRPPVSGCLSERGERQVQEMSAALADVRFDRVFASPLGRAIQTAQPLAEGASVEVEILDWLIEWRPATVLGECDEADFESLMAAAEKLRPERCWKTRAGEGTLEMAHRVISGFVDLMERLGVRAGHGGYLLDDPGDDRRVALVAHGGSLGRLAAFLLGVPIAPYAPIAFEQTGVAVFTFVRRVDVWYPALRISPPRPLAELDAVADARATDALGD